MNQIQSWATIILLAIGAWQGAKAVVILTSTRTRNSEKSESES